MLLKCSQATQLLPSRACCDSGKEGEGRVGNTPSTLKPEKYDFNAQEVGRPDSTRSSSRESASWDGTASPGGVSKWFNQRTPDQPVSL